MADDTLQEFDRLVGAGFSEAQTRALVETFDAPARTDPEVKSALTLMAQQLDQINQKFDVIDQRFDVIDQRFDGIDRRFDGIDKRFDGIDKRLDEHGRLIEVMLPLVQMIPAMSYEIRAINQRVDKLGGQYGPIQEDQHEIRAELHIVGERVKMEGRVARMINVALIAIGATVASLLAVFAR